MIIIFATRAVFELWQRFGQQQRQQQQQQQQRKGISYFYNPTRFEQVTGHDLPVRIDIFCKTLEMLVLQSTWGDAGFCPPRLSSRTIQAQQFPKSQALKIGMIRTYTATNIQWLPSYIMSSFVQHLFQLLTLVLGTCQ